MKGFYMTILGYDVRIYFLLFIIYAVAGWIMEVTCKLIQYKRFINRGFLIGPYCPIYGYGALLITFLLGKYKYERTNLTIEEQKQEIQYRINSVEMSLRKLVKNTLATLKGINKAKELVLKVMTEHTAIQSYDLTKANSLS